MSAQKSVTVRRIRNKMMLCYTLILLAVIFAVCTYGFLTLRSTAYSEISEQIDAFDIGFCSAVNYFTETAESDCTAVMRDETLMSYNPVSSEYADYEAAQIKNDVRDRLLEISAGKSYNDFLLVFSDSTSVGKISTGASELINEKGFDGIAELLGESADGWLFGLSEKYQKIYYIRIINDNELFILSLYSEILSSALSFDNADSDNIYLLADSSDRIILSNSEDITSGEAIPKTYSDLFDYSDGDSVISDSYIGASLLTDCGWRVITLTETPALAKISPLTGSAIIGLTVIIIMLSLLTGFLACAKFTSADSLGKTDEFTDPVTGTLNEYGLDESISELMETSIIGSTYAFILISIKDSKNVTQHLSQRYRNSIVKGMTSICKDYFSDKESFIGRVNEDMTAVFANYSEFDIFKAHEKLKAGCEGLCRAFDGFVAEGSDLRLDISIGVCIYPDHAESFDELMQKSELALDKANMTDNSSFVIYDPADFESKEGCK